MKIYEKSIQYTTINLITYIFLEILIQSTSGVQGGNMTFFIKIQAIYTLNLQLKNISTERELENKNF